MIDKLFSMKVKITDSNIMLVEYCKQWVKTWFFELKTNEEYDYSYNGFRKFMDSDRAKTEFGHVGHAREQIMDSYIQYSFVTKEHRMALHMRNTVRVFYSCTTFQVEHEKRSLKAPCGTKPSRIFTDLQWQW
jgi:hypothetical protein